MSKLKLHHLFGILFATLCLALIPLRSDAATKSKTLKSAQSTKERLVLMPLRLGEEDKSRQAAMEIALLEGLQQKYEVFSGEQVAKKAREIFMKESKNTAHKECDETRCLQGIAESFQAELLAIASVSKQADGYFLALSIQNIFDNKVVYSKSLPCQNCNAYQVVDRLKELPGVIITTAQPASSLLVSQPIESIESQIVGNPKDPENSLWTGVKSTNSIEDYETYLAQYPNGRYAALAQSLISKLKESEADQAWQATNKAGGESDYLNYINKYPLSPYIELAKIKFNKLKVAHDAAVAAGYVSHGGLTWTPATEWKSWEDANSYCLNTSFLGKVGWRLPTKDELNAFYVSGQGQTPGGQATWTSTPYKRGHYGVGSITYDFVDTYGDANQFPVRCVR